MQIKFYRNSLVCKPRGKAFFLTKWGKRQMKIIKNTSLYDTKKLKSLFCFIHNLLAKDEGRLPQWATLTIEIKKHKHSKGYSGWAYLGKVYGDGADMCLRMGKDLSLNGLAQLFAHELMHSYGYDHQQFQTDPLYQGQLDKIKAKFNKDDLLSPKAFHVPKKGVSYKQKCKDLMKEFEWLTIQRHPREEFREIEVNDDRDDCLCYEDKNITCTCDRVFDMRMNWRADNMNWKQAYENALLLILQNEVGVL